MQRRLIPTQIPAEGDDVEAIPFLDLAVWESILPALGSRSLSELPPIALPLNFGPETTLDYAAFERMAFHVLGFALRFFYSPAPLMEHCHEAFITNSGATLHSWIAVGNRRPKTSCFAAKFSAQHFQPFEGALSHETACNGPLSGEFANQVACLGNGDALFFWCGGKAPLDFIFLEMHPDGQTCHARYGDAKHQSGDQNFKDIRGVISALVKKVVMVHNGLASELSKFGKTLDPMMSLAVVTNCGGPDDTGVFVETFKDVQADTGETVRVFLLRPGTFDFPPWTDVMYRLNVPSLCEDPPDAS
jgi:hypothetical protein